VGPYPQTAVERYQFYCAPGRLSDGRPAGAARSCAARFWSGCTDSGRIHAFASAAFAPQKLAANALVTEDRQSATCPAPAHFITMTMANCPPSAISVFWTSAPKAAPR
jgi:hypothetical protein